MTNQAKTDNYPRLSRPFESLKPEYDVLVIGSGYGAGVAASRMARAGKSVAVLELGWERRSGSFPLTFSQCLRDLNVSGNSRRDSLISKLLSRKDPTRLLQLSLGDGQHVFSAHGLGGSSLINAGVFLKADRKTLQMSPWPSEIKDEPSVIDEYYSRAETMLQPSVYPHDFSALSKVQHLQEQAEYLGQAENFRRVPLTICFRRGRNNVGVQLEANRRTGHECTGLNDGSKNSVATTYLADAWNWGAEIFCGCEVRFVEKSDEGYIVHFFWHGNGRTVFEDRFKEQLFWVKAREFCFLGAGSLGTTEILLRSKHRGLQMSPMVGRNLSGNGDLLIFGYNGNANVNGIARQSLDSTGLPGPTITSVLDNRDNVLDGSLSGHVVQDGCIPEAFNPVVHPMLIVQTVKSQLLSLLWSPWKEKRRALAILKCLLLGPYALGGSLQRTSTYLVMSHDSNEITLTLKKGQLGLSAPKEGQSEHLKKIKGIFNGLFTRTGATMGFSYFYGRYQEEVTVHLLGGANMSSDGTGQCGVTNHIGEVFTGHGSEVYSGFICCDASVIPTALSVNPLATISALSERSVDLIAKKNGLSIDLMSKNEPLNINSMPRVSNGNPYCQESTELGSSSIGWQFTEALSGHIYMGPNFKHDELSEDMGRDHSCAMQMLLTIEICKNRGYQGICTGTVSCYALSPSALRVTHGILEFFTQVEESAEELAILYHLNLLSVDGTTYYLEGRKFINSKIALSPRKTWQATTSVHVRITRPDGTTVGTGVVYISLRDFQRQIQTFRTTRAFHPGLVLAMMAFLLSFIYSIGRFFFCRIGPLRYPDTPRGIPRSYADPKKPASSSYNVKTIDDVRVHIDVYEPVSDNEMVEDKLSSPPILLIPGVTGVGTRHNLFALPYLRCNMVEYFTKRGQRCYVLTPRWGCDSVQAQRSTVFDCRLDVAAAITSIREREPQSPYVIAHCQGAVALSMGILDGTIDSSQILGVTANSVFMNQVFGYWNSLKGRTTLLIRLYEFLAGDYFPISSGTDSPFIQRILDLLLRLYPVGHRDICHSTACRRTSFVFGLLWNHENLDLGIHDNIHQFFAGTYTKLMEQVVRMGSRGVCLSNDLSSLLTDQGLQRLQGLPILFISGTENQVFDPESTLKDYELLRRRFGERYYRRFLAEGYGHLDPIVGKDAATDVYWKVFNHVQWCLENEASSERRSRFI